MFPEHLIERFRKEGVSHVVIVPDPSVATLPFSMLETTDGLVVDQPWSISVVTSSMELQDSH